MKIKDGYLLKNVAGEYIIVPVKKGALKAVMTLNETGALLFKKFQDGCDKEAAVSILLENYDIDKSTAIQDTDNFIKVLKEANLIEK